MDLDTSTEQGYLPDSPEYRRVMVSIFTAGVITFAIMYDCMSLAPHFVDVFELSPAASTLAMSTTTTTLAFALVICGLVSSAVQRTTLIRGSLILSTLFTLGCIAAPNWGTLLVLRALQGATLAGVATVAAAYLRDELHPSTHGKAVGLYIGGTAIGGMTGRLLTAFITQAVGWRWGIAVVGILALIGTLIVLKLLPASRGFTPAKLSSVKDLVGVLVGALKDPTLLALYGFSALGTAALVANFTGTTFRLKAEPFSLAVGTVSLIFLVYPLGTVASTYAGRMADKLGKHNVMPVCCAVMVLGALVTWGNNIFFVVGGLAIVTVGYFSAHGLATGWVVAGAHSVGAAPGQANGLYLFAHYVFTSVFSPLAGYSWSTWATNGVVGLAIIAGLACCVVALLIRRTVVREDAASLAVDSSES
jgi:YNFM family putative membrane transporter